MKIENKQVEDYLSIFSDGSQEDIKEAGISFKKILLSLRRRLKK